MASLDPRKARRSAVQESAASPIVVVIRHDGVREAADDCVFAPPPPPPRQDLGGNYSDEVLLNKMEHLASSKPARPGSHSWAQRIEFARGTFITYRLHHKSS